MFFIFSGEYSLDQSVRQQGSRASNILALQLRHKSNGIVHLYRLYKYKMATNFLEKLKREIYMSVYRVVECIVVINMPSLDCHRSWRDCFDISIKR